jgi:hypothetical protein
MNSLEGGRLLIGIMLCVGLLACDSEVREIERAGIQAHEEGQAGLLRLDLANRTLVYPIRPRIAKPEKVKFVQTEISRIVNPRLIRIIFEVRYRPKTGAEVFLGTFSPFPPDRTGTYIVPTAGSLRPGGAIVLSMILLDEVKSQDVVEVDLKAVSFREE